MMTCRLILVRMRNISDKICRENQNTYFTIFFFKRKTWDNLEKYCTGGRATDDNKAHAHCIL